AVSRAHLFQRNAPYAAPRAVGDIAGKLTAGGRDAVAAGFARGHRQAGALQDLGEAPDSLRARAAEPGMREGIERDQVELAAHMARDTHQFARVRVRVVHALEHDVLESDEVARRLFEVAVARRKQLAQRVFAVHGDQLVAQRVVRRMQRERQRDGAFVAQPAWLDTQSVPRFDSGMKTASTALLPSTLSSHLRVPSCAAVSPTMRGASMQAQRASLSRSGLARSLMRAKSVSPRWWIQCSSW